MQLTLRSLKGCVKLEGLKEDVTVAQLKQLLHAHHNEALAVPAPEKQRLVYKDSVLQEGLLREAGVVNGDDLVLLVAEELPQPQPLASTPAPDAAAVRKAIVAEARRRGTEGQLREEAAPARPRRMFNMPLDMMNMADMDPSLARLLEQVMGNVQVAMVPGAAEEEEEQQAQPPQPIAPPEPSAANLAQLTDMGFPEAVARKALLLTKDNVQAALEWVLQHMDDVDAAEPPTQEQLQQVYGPRRRVRPSPESMLNQLTEMGFDAESASQALRRFGNLDLALAFLLSGGGTGGSRGASGAGIAGAGAAAPAGQRDAAAAQQAAGAGAAAAAAPQAVNVGGRAAGQQEAGASGRAAADERGDVEMGRGSPLPTPSGRDRDGGSSDDQSMHDAEDDGQGLLPMEHEGAGEEDDEDEYEDYEDEEEDEGYPIEFEDAIGNIDLATLGSADMEQLMAGAGVNEMFEHLLFQAGGMDAAGVAGAGDVLLRLVEAPAVLQSLHTGGAAALGHAPQDGGAGGAAGGSQAAGGQAPGGGDGQQPERAQQQEDGGGAARQQ